MLPKLPAQSTKRAVDTVAFLGLNRTENFRDGEMRDMQNLSAAEYPTITPRQKRTALTGYTNPTDIFEWDGKLVVVDDGVLYYDGTAVGSVNPGKKQFAVVNTKLCVWPDKVYLDLTNNTFGRLDEEVSTGTQAGSVTVTDDSITATVTEMVSQGVQIFHEWRSNSIRGIEWNMASYSYGVDRQAVEACFVNGAWDLTALEPLQSYKGFAIAAQDGKFARGDVIIPHIVRYTNPDRAYYCFVYGKYDADPDTPSEWPDTTQYNDEGYYVVLHSDPQNGDDGYYVLGDVYKTGTGNALFSAVFKVGDAVDVSGTRFGIADAKHLVITEISDTTNTLTFSEGALRAPAWYYVVESDVSPVVPFILYFNNTVGYRSFSRPSVIPAGRVLWCAETDVGKPIYIWNTETKRIEAEYTLTVASSGSGYKQMTAYDPIDGASITIGKAVPDLDFICAKDNRLWGVSNSQENEAYNAQTGAVETFTSRVIYASALGDPSNWWVFQGVDTDSWQVAVGSEGDFTAITAFDGVCCWKENRLHKILGSYPSEYYMSETRVEGVAAGSDRSCTVVNEVLYYAGRNGVYAFTGGAPVSIGEALGFPLANAVGGSDGKVWYLSGERPDGDYELLTYDLTRGLWMREDATKAEAFANAAGTLHFLAGNQGHYDGSTPPVWVRDPNVVIKTGQGADNTLEWYAEFCPYWEMSSSRYASTALRRRYYLRTHLRLEMSAGSHITVEVKHDDLAWNTLLDADSAVAAVKSVEIPPRRCDKLVVRISGTGNVLLRHMAREYIVGSERP